MKEQYIEAEMDIIVLDCDDVIATSSYWYGPPETLPDEDFI